MTQIYLKDLPNVVTAELETTVHSLAQSMKYEVEIEINKVRRQIFQRFADEIVGRGSAPGWGINSPPRWRQLRKSWVKRKGHDRFYYYKGELRDKLMSLTDPDGLLGPASVQFTQKASRIIASRRTKSGISYRRTEMELDPIRLRNRITGRATVSLQAVQGILEVIPFTKVANLTDNDQAVEKVFGADDDKIGAKLTNWRGEQRRPALGWFINWYVRTQIMAAIDRGLRRAR